jgi:branched-chain amino acid aminotransferase group I
MEEVVYFNGSLVPRSQARISVFDHGFLYGYGLFETMRAYGGKIFRLDRHLKRILTAAEIIGMESGLAGIDLAKACLDTLEANGLKDARLRLTVSRGEVESFPGTGAGAAPTVLVTAKAYTPLSKEAYARGFRAGIPSLRRYSGSPLSRLKSTSYMVSVLAKMESEAAGLDEALLLNENGSITEGSISNVFFVSSGSLVTPPVDSGILPGVTRETVLEIARVAGMRVAEREVKPEELGRFDEAFLTNSVMEVMPLVEVRDAREAITIGSGKPGKLTGKLMAAYKEMVEREIG